MHYGLLGIGRLRCHRCRRRLHLRHAGASARRDPGTTPRPPRPGRSQSAHRTDVHRRNQSTAEATLSTHNSPFVGTSMSMCPLRTVTELHQEATEENAAHIGTWLDVLKNHNRLSLLQPLTSNVRPITSTEKLPRRSPRSARLDFN